MGPWWFKFFSYFLDYPARGSFIGIITLLSSLFSIIWGISNAAGITGSIKILFLIIGISGFMILILIPICKVLRWSLVYAAVKSFIRNELYGIEIKEDTILIGGSSGGGLAVGMVGKAVQELHGKSPRVLVIDQDYVMNKFAPDTGTLLELRDDLKNKHILYVSSYIGTGRSRHAMFNELQISGCKTFAFVVDEAVLNRDNIEYYLVIGKRAVIPWPK